MTLDALDRRILDAVQSGFPIEPQPFSIIAEQVGGKEDEVLGRLQTMQNKGIVREIGPVFNPHRLGFKSCLCTAKVRPDALESGASFINGFAEVTHNYFRNNPFNVWFTVIARTEDRIAAILSEIQTTDGVIELMSLPAERVFKIGVQFTLAGNASNGPRLHRTANLPKATDKNDVVSKQPVFQDWEVRILRALDRPLPLVLRPFAETAGRAGVSEANLLDKTRSWVEGGLIRRFGAKLDHYLLGYTANGMSVWNCPPDMVETAGQIMAGQPEVSHCYLRTPRPGWNYNLYAMIHGGAERDVLQTVSRIAEQTGLVQFNVLFSIREFKKSSPRYFPDAQATSDGSERPKERRGV